MRLPFERVTRPSVSRDARVARRRAQIQMDRTGSGASAAVQSIRSRSNVLARSSSFVRYCSLSCQVDSETRKDPGECECAGGDHAVAAAAAADGDRNMT